ncbi:MAG: hypothetical protein O6761_01050 [Thaumarchaeota archaeon]|nr:hypothetical protein [Nitrososphaerota archaeon]
MIKNAENKTKFLILTSTIAMMMIAPAVGTPNAFAAANTLPGGTAIEVTITSPLDGQMFAVPPGGTIDVPVEGTADVGMGVARADTTLLYVIDNSGSTGAFGGGNCGEQQNADPQSVANQIIDCELLAVKNLNAQAIALGSVDEVSMTVFAGGAATADATPGAGDVAIITPNADANALNGLDVDEVLISVRTAVLVGELGGFTQFTVKNHNIFGTNFFAAIQEMISVAGSATNPNVVGVFLSDGIGNSAAALLPNANIDVIHTFAVGVGAVCAGTLKQISDLTGGTCTQVPDPNNLPNIIPGLIGSTLDSLEIEVDGGGASAIPNSEIDPDLPMAGPNMVDYSTTATGLGFGTHEICVTANGTDVGGEGDVTECVDIEVKEFEKFYTGTDNNWDLRCEEVETSPGVFEEVCRPANITLDGEENIFAEQLPKNGDGAFVLLGKENPKKTTVTPGQYIAVSEVTVPSDQSVWIEEDFGECVGEDNIGFVNPNKVPGGVQVVLVLANGDVIDIDDDLALGIGGSILLEDGKATVHVDDVPAEATLRVMVKFGPNHDPGMIGLECTNFERLLDENGPFAEVSATLVIEEK